MHVTRCRDPQSFLKRAESFLLRAEAENNLMFGIAALRHTAGDDVYLATVDEEDAVLACGLRTPRTKR